MEIGESVVQWFHNQGRKLPWRDSHDPYLIWVGEVIFQQTRIQQGETYFYRFTQRFSNVFELAQASQDEVLKYWEGLGYYARARNMHQTAIYVVEELKGIFPQTHTELMKLKGIGPYTSRAIASFAFGSSVGVLDGNVLRVVSRITGDATPINDPKARNAYQNTVDSWVETVDSRSFNYAMMDLGSMVCTPTRPGCLICPVQEQCVAFRDGLTQLLPQKKKTLKRKLRHFIFFLVQDEDGQIAIRKRPENVFWGGLWEIPNKELPRDSWETWKPAASGKIEGRMKHVFTHFDMMIKVCRINLADFSQIEDSQFIPTDKIRNFAFSRAVKKIFEQFLWQSMD